MNELVRVTDGEIQGLELEDGFSGKKKTNTSPNKKTTASDRPFIVLGMESTSAPVPGANNEHPVNSLHYT